MAQHDFSKLARAPNSQSDKFAQIEAQIKSRFRALEQQKPEPSLIPDGTLIATQEKTDRKVVRTQVTEMPVNTRMSAQPDDEDDFDERYAEDEEEEEPAEEEEEEEEEPAEEEEDDDDEVIVPPTSPKLVTPPAAPKKRGRPPKVKIDGQIPSALPKPLQTLQNNKDANDLYQALEQYDLGDGNYNFTITRSKPEMWNGKAINGYLSKFNHPIQPEDLKQQFGGGTYVVTIAGPNPKLNGKYGIVAKRPVVIAGDPIVRDDKGKIIKSVDDPVETTPDAAMATVMPMLQRVLDTKDEDAKRAQQEMKEMQKMMLQSMQKDGGGMKDMFVTMATMMNPQGAREDLREERRLAEERRAAEREERRHEQDMAERRFQQQIEVQREENKRQLEMLKIEMERQKAEAMSNTSRSENMFQTFMSLSDKANADKEARAREHTQFLMSSMQQQQAMAMQQMTEFAKTKTDFLEQQIKLSKGNDEFSSLDKLLKYKELLSTLTGSGDGDGRATWEKVMDRVGEVVQAPATIALAGRLLTGAAVANPQRALPPPPQAQGRPAPGTVAEVVMPPPAAQRRRPKTSPMLQRQPPQRQRQPVVEQPPQVEAQPTPQEPQIIEAEVTLEQVNDLKVFTFPQDGMSIDQVVDLLVRNIDLAVQQDLSADDVYDQVIKKFPQDTIALLKAVPPTDAINTIKSASPKDWYINTPSGGKMIRELFDILHDDG